MKHSSTLSDLNCRVVSGQHRSPETPFREAFTRSPGKGFPGYGFIYPTLFVGQTTSSTLPAHAVDPTKLVRPR